MNASTPADGEHRNGRPEGAPGRAWHTAARVVVDPLPPDWRERLAARLGERPRRVGRWAELALYGARLCLDAAGESTLPAGARLRVASLRGPLVATRLITEQARAGLVMPFGFMQSQPSHMLAALGRHLGWQGDAQFIVSRDPEALLKLACHGCGPAGVLIGWVDEDSRTEWHRLRPAAEGRTAPDSQVSAATLRAG